MEHSARRETVALIVPCYNEAPRLRPHAFLEALAQYPSLRLVLVDDGSKDDTPQILSTLAAESRMRACAFVLPTNCGKAEAVRQGMKMALESCPESVGYWDADLATPFDALSDFLEVLRLRPDVDIVMGSRVQLLGRRIERSASRHYAGRVFATGASIVLGLPVYDTQCGAKVFRASARLRRILESPFVSRWIFDVELIARYLDDRAGAATEPAPSSSRIYELALRTWEDAPGSKVRPRDGVRATLDLLRIYRERRRS